MRELGPFAWRVVLSAIVMAGVALLLYTVVSANVDPVHWTGQATILAIVGVSAGLIYIGLSLTLGVDDARRVASSCVVASKSGKPPVKARMRFSAPGRYD